MNQESLWTPQTVIAILLLTIGAATVAGVFVKGSQDAITTIAGMVIGFTMGAPSGFYFGASKEGPKKATNDPEHPSPHG